MTDHSVSPDLRELLAQLDEARNRTIKEGSFEEHRTMVEIGDLADRIARAALQASPAPEGLRKRLAKVRRDAEREAAKEGDPDAILDWSDAWTLIEGELGE